VAQEGSDKQFEELLIPLMDDLYRLARRLERDSDRAQDLLQDALLKGFRNFRKLQKQFSFRPWMGRILYRTFLDRRRTKTVEVALSANMGETPGPLEFRGRAPGVRHRPRTEGTSGGQRPEGIAGEGPF